MGESYLQRKVFNRMRHMRTQASVPSAQTNSIDSEWLPMPSNSNSSPQLNLMKNGLLTDDLECSVSSLGSDGDVTFSSNNTSNNITSVPKRLGRSSVSKLKSVSRAMLFFHRTTSSSSATNNGNSATDAEQRPMGAGKPSSQASTEEHVSPTLDGSQINQHRARTDSSFNYNNNNNNNQVPRFIVPKMNALKLPQVCLIKSLDGELMREVFVHRYELGQYLIESLKVSVGINDCKYFGLKMAKSFDDQEDLKNVWLDLNESVCKQIKNKTNLINLNTSCGGVGSSSNNSLCGNSTLTHTRPQSSGTTTTNQRSIDFYLRIKFYPPNLARVQDPFLRNYLWLQLRRDLRLGKLTSSMNNLTLLMACVLQYELGDFREELVEKIPELNILPNQDLIEEQASELWSTRLVGYKRHQAQMQFIRVAVILETYGFDYYPVRDHQRQRAYLLGFNYAGIKTIRNGRIVHHFSWHSLSKISYERRMIIFHIYPTENSKRKQILGFKCLSNEDCQSLYMRLLEQKYFFTVDLAYFDKSIRRPTCLYPGPAHMASADWGPAMQPDEQTPPLPQESRSTSCGPSLDANVDDSAALPLGNTSNGSGNSLESGESPDSSSSLANCYTCKREQIADCAQSTPAGHQEKENQATRGRINNSQHSFRPEKPESDDEEEHEKSQIHPPPTASNTVSLRRTQWHRRRPKRQYFSGAEEDQSQAESESTYTTEPDQQARRHGTEPGRDQGIWARLMTCIKSCESNSDGVLSQRLAQFAEVLIQPMNAFQCSNKDDKNSEIPTRSSSSIGTRFQVIMPALRFCLMILVMNFVIHWTDSISSSLIELLTLTLTRNSNGAIIGQDHLPDGQ